MNIRAKFRLSKKREKPKTSRSFPIQMSVRSRGFNNLYSHEDFLIDLIRYCTIKQQVYHPHIAKLIVEFVPIYSWADPQLQRRRQEGTNENIEDEMKVTLSHCNTIVSNSWQKFGAVLGSKLDPRLDHIINVQLVEGVEFGVGICDWTQLNWKPRRDFMCIEGGYGYYNYKRKSSRLKPKYPPGLYYQVQNCRKVIEEAGIFQPGDVLTMVVQREKLKSPGGGSHSLSRPDCKRDDIFDPVDNLIPSAKYSLSFYKNGEDMGFHLQNLVGPFYICLNYYFVASKVRLLSDYNFRKKHRRFLRRQSYPSGDRDFNRVDCDGFSRSLMIKSSYI